MTTLLQEWVTTQAGRRPEAVAVVGAGEALTYAELDAQSNQLARVLKAAGCTKGDRVCVLMPKSPTAIVGILGIYKADGIYVPLDPASPPARLATLIGACESRWVLAAGSVDRLLEEVLGELRTHPKPITVGWLGTEPAHADRARPGFTWEDLRRSSAAALTYQNSSQDPAHILFTSGSTGTPKGVVITHANVIAFVQWAISYFGMSPADRNSGHPPLHFDLSMLDIFGTFAAGAQLHLVPPELNLLPHKLAEFIRTQELTQWFSVPSLLNYMAKFDVIRPHDFPRLRRLLWCGEVFPTPALIHWMRRLPHVTFTNLYGPTETTIASSYYTLPDCPEDETAAIPIGVACPGEELLVLGEQFHPLPTGEVGELYIRGVGLSPGYWRDPERTRAAFVPTPSSTDPHDRLYKTGDLARLGEDGLVYFLGRADSQIKSRGHRIELGEVEAAVQALDSVAECAVVAVTTDGFEGAMICCAYVPASGSGATPVGLRSALSRVLPGYMLPFRWLRMEALPKNANGKIDRPRLRETFQETPAGREAQAHRQS